MKTFVPRHSKKFQENPNTPTAKTDKTPTSPSFVSFCSDPQRVFQKNSLSEVTEKQARAFGQKVDTLDAIKKRHSFQNVPAPQSNNLEGLIDSPTKDLCEKFENTHTGSLPKLTKPSSVTPVTLEPDTLNQLMLLEALVWSGKYEGKNIEELKAYLWRWFERGDETALDPLLAYLELEDVQTILRTLN
jgi:hypothetical protein